MIFYKQHSKKKHRDTENLKDTSKNGDLHNWINLVNNTYCYYYVCC